MDLITLLGKYDWVIIGGIILSILVVIIRIEWLYKKIKAGWDMKHPFNNYLNHLIDDFEKDELSKYYVDLEVEKREGGKIETDKPVDKYINEWLTKEDKNHISILGGYGTGKTSFCRKYAHDVAKKRKGNTLIEILKFILVIPSIVEKYICKRGRLPVLIKLRDYSKDKDLKGLIVKEIKNYDTQFSHSTFEKMNNKGEILLILDGFDEMAQKTGKDTPHSILYEIAELVKSKSKVILTSRTEYFKDSLEEMKVLCPDKEDMNFWEKPNFEILYLELFGDEQIKTFLKKRVSLIKEKEHDWEYYYDKIKEGVYDLYELSQRPVLLYMVTKTLPKLIKQGKKITTANLYDMYIEGELDRLTKIKKLNLNIEREKRRELLKGLASYMFLNHTLNVHYDDITEVEEIKNFFSQVKKDKGDNIEPYFQEFLVYSFLNRDGEGNYYFSHKSFMEFFCARKFFDEIRNGNKSNFGKKLIPEEIANFLVDLIKDKNYSNILFNFIDYTKNRELKEDEKYICRNTVTLLKLSDESFSGKDFSNADFTDVDFSNTDLTGTDFSNAVLKNANLKNIILNNADFSNADLGGVIFKKGHNGEVESVFVTPDGKYIVSGSADKTIKIWDFEKGEEIRTLRGHQKHVSSVFVTPDKKHIVSGSFDKTIKIWDFKEGKEIRTLKGHTDMVLSVFVTPDGKYIVSGSGDQDIIIWDFEKGKCIRAWRSSIWGTGHQEHVSSVFVTPDGKYIVSGSGDKNIKIWDFEKGERIGTLLGHHEYVMSVFVTPDGKYIVSGSDDKTIKIWDFEKGEKRGDMFLDLIVCPDGRYECGTVRGEWVEPVKLSDFEKGKGIRTLKGHNGTIMSVFVTPDGKYIVSGSFDKTIKIWDFEKGEEIRTLRGDSISSVFVTPDGKYIVSGSYDKTIKIWDFETGECIRTIEQKLECKGMNIKDAKGLTEKQIKFLKERGAVEK